MGSLSNTSLSDSKLSIGNENEVAILLLLLILLLLINSTSSHTAGAIGVQPRPIAEVEKNYK